MITLTESAATRLSTMLEKKDLTGVRAGVKGGGCSGFTYSLAFDSEKPGDKVIENLGVKIYVDPKSYLYLMGTEIDYVDELNQSGFYSATCV